MGSSRGSIKSRSRGLLLCTRAVRYSQGPCVTAPLHPPPPHTNTCLTSGHLNLSKPSGCRLQLCPPPGHDRPPWTFVARNSSNARQRPLLGHEPPPSPAFHPRILIVPFAQSGSSPQTVFRAGRTDGRSWEQTHISRGQNEPAFPRKVPTLGPFPPRGAGGADCAGKGRTI